MRLVHFLFDFDILIFITSQENQYIPDLLRLLSAHSERFQSLFRNFLRNLIHWNFPRACANSLTRLGKDDIDILFHSFQFLLNDVLDLLNNLHPFQERGGGGDC